MLRCAAFCGVALFCTRLHESDTPMTLHCNIIALVKITPPPPPPLLSLLASHVLTAGFQNLLPKHKGRCKAIQGTQPNALSHTFRVVGIGAIFTSPRSLINRQNAFPTRTAHLARGR